MSSFYGRCSIGGGGGSTDYNDMTNVPIKNLIGTDKTKFINLAGLDPGHYNLKGYYKKDSQDEVQHSPEAIDLLVMVDSVTNKKTIQYLSIQNEILYSNLIIYNNSLIERQEKIPIGGEVEPEIHWGEIII